MSHLPPHHFAVYHAMLFATEVHRLQKRRYTNLPYITHLAEVAGLVASVGHAFAPSTHKRMMQAAWLHDTMEDQGVKFDTLSARFGKTTAFGVRLLSDLDRGGQADRALYETDARFRVDVDRGAIKLYNREERLQRTIERLRTAPAWVQTVKVADSISNTRDIVHQDPKFAAVYLPEKRRILEVLTKAEPVLLKLAHQYAEP